MKGYLKILLPITILSIAVPSGYFLGGYKLVDSNLEKGINKDLDEITENKYTGAIKSTAKKSDLENVNKKMDFIYSKSLKDDISNRTKAIRSQIDLQTTLKEESAQWYAEHTSSSILNKGKIQSDIKKASNILNTSVKKEIVKNNYIVMDRIEYVDMTRQKLDSIKNSQLSESSLPLYYSVSGYLDEMFYSNDKRQMESELKQIKSKIDKSISDSQTNETKSEEEKVKNVKEKTYTFQKSTSIKKDLNDYEFAGFKFLNSTNNVNVLVLSTKENKIYKFSLNTSRDGVSEEEKYVVESSGSISNTKNNDYKFKSEVNNSDVNPVESSSSTSSTSGSSGTTSSSSEENDKDYTLLEFSNDLGESFYITSSDNKKVNTNSKSYIYVDNTAFNKIKDMGGDIIVV